MYYFVPLGEQKNLGSNATKTTCAYFIFSSPMSTKRKTTKRKADEIAAEDEQCDLPELKKQKLNPTLEKSKMEGKILSNNILGAGEVEQIELPPEILVSIFSLLEVRDLSGVSCVSQHWWLCSKDESLTWSLVSTIPLVERLENYNGHCA